MPVMWRRDALVPSFPEPVYHGYEVQMFSCLKCDAEITRSADRKGKPHPPAVLIDLEEPPRSIARGASE